MTSSISVGYFSPSSLTGCVLWLDGSSLGLANGATVSTWRSLGPVAYTTTSTTGRFPTYATNVKNGLGCVQYATGQTTVLSNFVLAQTMSIFQVSYPIGQAFHPFLEHGPDENANPGFYFYSGGGNNFAINSGTGQVAVNTGNVGVTNTWLIQEGLNKDPNATNTMAYYSNATLVASGGVQNGTTTVTNTLFLNGRNNTNTVSYPGYVAELIIFSNALNNFGRQQVEGYLAWKWGLVSLLPSTHPYKNSPYFVLTEQVPRAIPTNAFLLPVNTFSTIKTFTLPTVSTNPGQMLILKDYLGSANSNVIRLSTLGLDRIERSNVSSMVLSNSYGAWTFMNDGITKWFLTNAYLNTLYTFGVNNYVTTNLVYFLDAGNTSSYPGSGSTWTNLMGTGNNVTLYNSPTYSSANGGYLTFVPASSQYGECATSLTYMSNYTIEVWHYYTNYSGTYPCIVTENYPGTTSKIAYCLGVATGTVPAINNAFFTGAWQATATWTPTANNWYHIVGTYDGANLKLYVNNSNVVTTANTTVVQANTGGFRLMRRWDNPDYWGGRLAIYRVYNRAITASEVSQNYSAERGRFGL